MLNDNDDHFLLTFQTARRLNIHQTYHILLSCGVTVPYGEDSYKFSLDGLQTIQALHIMHMEMHIIRTKTLSQCKLLCFICIEQLKFCTPLTQQAASSLQLQNNQEPIPADLLHHIK